MRSVAVTRNLYSAQFEQQEKGVTPLPVLMQIQPDGGRVALV